MNLYWAKSFIVAKNLLVVGLISTLFACSSVDRFAKESRNSRSYASNEQGKMYAVTKGVIVSIKPVKLSGTKALGATLGGVIGGIAGASTTDKKYNQEIAGALGALSGVMLGSALEELSTEGVGFEFLIKTESGLKAFIEASRQDLAVGDAVYIVHSGDTVRISKQFSKQ